MGTGSSRGTPEIGCDCQVCKSEDPRDFRNRSSGVIYAGGKTILVDVPPDLRYTCLREGIRDIDGVIVTHHHYDHCGGFDDLRIPSYQAGGKMPIICLESTFTEMKKRYGYLFEVDPPLFQAEIVGRTKEHIHLLGVEMTGMIYQHAGIDVLGFRIGDFAYIIDIKLYSESIFEILEGVKTLVISAIGEDDNHPVHLSVKQAIEFSKRVKAKRTYLSHLSHRLGHETTSQKLPDGVFCAYDGLRLEFEY
ncbi:MAG: Ribonuclease BN [Chlamydiia bacterium]|nr:Ribonuclease BN [Chlamydiia bacterium]